MINYRNLNDLNSTIKKNLHRVPRDLSLIVGIPRSGLLAANILSLYLNLPLTDVEGLLTGHIFESGKRLKDRNYMPYYLQGNKILVVDDSVYSGETMKKIKDRISAANLNSKMIFAAIYVSHFKKHELDLYFEKINGERIFEWNLMHSWTIKNSCVDIDGVLCNDPKDEENDDGPRYENFLRNAIPLNLPSVEIGCLVTCRLEKYRRLTEQWLKKMNIQYKNLIMLKLETKEERQKYHIHAKFKARVYKSSNARLFIESSFRQAEQISKIAKKPVLCIDTQQMIYPSVASYTVNKVINDPHLIHRQLNRFFSVVKRKLLDIDPPANII